MLVKDRGRLKAFYESASSCQSVKIGFDSCCVPGIVTWMNANPALIDSCEAARFSAFISEDMKMYPCSFMANTDQYGDLRKEKLLDIWQTHPAFVKHRDEIRFNSCVVCKHQAVCHGGCVFMPEINQCGQNC
jgi:radical SAM protein with 4Fe4S-binding SPASM domain